MVLNELPSPRAHKVGTRVKVRDSRGEIGVRLGAVRRRRAGLDRRLCQHHAGGDRPATHGTTLNTRNEGATHLHDRSSAPTPRTATARQIVTGVVTVAIRGLATPYKPPGEHDVVCLLQRTAERNVRR